MMLPVDEFIRRFLLHVLPNGFHRIRHYGFLAGAARVEIIVASPSSGPFVAISDERRELSRVQDFKRYGCDDKWVGTISKHDRADLFRCGTPGGRPLRLSLK